MKTITLTTLLASGLAALTAFAVICPAEAQTNLYRWVDADGKIHYTDQPPPKDAKKVEQKRVGGNYIEGDVLPFASRDAAKKNPVVLFVGRSCGGFCEDARALLSKRGIPFTEKEVEANPTYAEELKKLGGNLDVPTLTIGGKPTRGFEAEAWSQQLSDAGYPKTNASRGDTRTLAPNDVVKPKPAAPKPAPVAAPAAPVEAPE